MCETVKLCQEQDSDHDDPIRGMYSNFLDHESSHTERLIDELYQEEDTDDIVRPDSNLLTPYMQFCKILYFYPYYH